jgi:hypothetical protein
VTIVSSSLASLVNGVSQQPDSLRLPSQCELQENGYSSVVKGVRKRAPFRHLAKLFSTAVYASAYLHTINRDTTERYCVVITNGDLAVFGIDGTPKTVNFPNGKAYLSNANPAQGFVALTVADYTFIANKSVGVGMDGASAAATRNPEALIYVKQGNYSTTYAVNVSGVGGFSYTTGATGNIETTQIANNLYTSMTANATFNTLYAASLSGSCIYVTSRTTADFTLLCTDGLGDRSIIMVKGTVQRFSDLPPKAFDGFTVKVNGDQSNVYTGYWVKYVDPNGSSASGSWVETVQPGALTGLNAASMPWTLVRNGDGTFTFDKVAWTPRAVGNDTSAPPPSFVNKTINDVFFHRNRLGFLSGESVVFSKAGAFFNFWPDTITQVLDSDRIDISATHVKVSTLRAAVPFNDALLPVLGPDAVRPAGRRSC